MTYIIRKFKKEDAAKAGNMVTKTMLTSFKGVYSKKVINALCDHNTPSYFLKSAKERQYFVAEDKNLEKIVGVIGMDGNELKRFFVLPECQGQGVGRKLFERFKEEAVEKGYKSVFVHASENAQQIYESLGFKKLRKTKRAVNGLPFYDILMYQKIK